MSVRSSEGLSRRLFLLGSVAASTTSCRAIVRRMNSAGDRQGGGGDAPGYTRSTIRVEGAERTFFLHVPKQYHSGERLPIVFLLHGHGGTGGEFAAIPGAQGLRDRGVFVVSPSAIQRDWKMSDLHLLDGITSRLGQEYGCNPGVWVIGFSDGGGLAMQAGSSTNAVKAVGTMGITMPKGLTSLVTHLPYTVQVIGTHDPHYSGEDPESMDWEEGRRCVCDLVGASGSPTGPVAVPGGSQKTKGEIFTWPGSPGFEWVRVDGPGATHRVYHPSLGDGIDGIGVIVDAFAKNAALPII